MLASEDYFYENSQLKVVAEILNRFRTESNEHISVEYVDMTAEGVVIVRLKGHCGSCPHAMQTLKQGIESALKKVIPEVKSVEKI